MGDDQINGIISLHYASQLYDLFVNSPFYLTIVLDVRNGAELIELNEKKWIAEMGLSREDIAENGLFSYLYPGDVDRTLEAYNDVTKLREMVTFENRYRCNHKTPNSFKIGDEYFVWLRWAVNVEYRNSDRYRLSIAEVVDIKSEIFKRLQEEHEL